MGFGCVSFTSLLKAMDGYLVADQTYLKAYHRWLCQLIGIFCGYGWTFSYDQTHYKGLLLVVTDSLSCLRLWAGFSLPSDLLG
jgi:hypothetical protein